MRNFNDIMNERDRKIKEYENNKILKEKIEKQWNDIENNIDNAEINRDTKRLFICYGDIYEENKYKLIKDYGFHLDSFNKEIFSYTHNIIKDTEYCIYYYLDGIDDNTTVTEELNKNDIKTIGELHNKISNDIKKDLNKLNEDFLDKYNLNDGLHSEESKIDDVFGKKTDNKNKIKLQGIDIDKSNNKNDKTILQMYKYKDGEFKKINLDENNNYIKQQSKEDKLETFADLINHVLGFKYC